MHALVCSKELALMQFIFTFHGQLAVLSTYPRKIVFCACIYADITCND